MAFTLVLVSFSCTGPIVGSLLVASAGGEVIKPILGMAAFSSAFAIPFTLFAAFPQWLKNLPRSGGWLNSVKVVLGFLELGPGAQISERSRSGVSLGNTGPRGIFIRLDCHFRPDWFLLPGQTPATTRQRNEIHQCSETAAGHRYLFVRSLHDSGSLGRSPKSPVWLPASRNVAGF